jgi:hypothetical protein
MMTKRIKVKAIAKQELSSEELALVFLLMAKRHVREKREREARECAERGEVRRAS